MSRDADGRHAAAGVPHLARAAFSSAFSTKRKIWRRLNRCASSPTRRRPSPTPQALFDRVAADREQGFSIVDEELERGLRSIAVPIVDRDGRRVAALNLSTHSTRTTRNEMRDRFLPSLRAVAEQISASVV